MRLRFEKEVSMMERASQLFLCGVLIVGAMVSGCTTKTDDVVISPDGVEIRFDRLGEGRPALVFIHGWANDRSVWAAQAVHFSSNYEVVNIDLPSFGKSGKNRQHFTIEAFGEDVASVIEGLGLDEVVLIGFSMGATVAIEAATNIPEHVVGVVIVEEMHNIEAVPPPSAFDDIEEFYMDVITNPTNEKLVSNGFYINNQETTYQRVLSMVQVPSRDGWRESLRDLFRWLNEDCVESLGQLQVPLVAINAAMQPTNVEAFQKHVPSFQAKIVSDAGHLIMWDAPEEFDRLLAESIEEFMAASR